MIVAKSKYDLINEGEKLHHCVGKMDYDKRQAEGQSIICFIRKNDDKEIRKMDVKIKVFEGGSMPAYKRDGDACLDCRAREGAVIAARSRKLIPLGFALELPKGWEAVVRPRSGLSSEGFDVCIGTVDSNYRGELFANVVNSSEADLKVDVGDRVCQLAIREAPVIKLIPVDELSNTERGAAGFGSSGVK